MEIQNAYGRDSDGAFTHALPLDATSISEQAKQCPECRAAIHSVGRYSRITKYGVLRSLQRKHMEWMRERLTAFEQIPPEKRSPSLLLTALKDAKASPFQQVYDASGKEGDEPPLSPAGPIIRILMFLGERYAARSRGPEDEAFVKAQGSFDEAISCAKATESARSEAEAHLAIAGLMLPWVSHVPNYHSVVVGHLNVVIGTAVVSTELRAKAEELKENISNEARRRELQQVLSALNVRGVGYDYGTSASDHWYQCPNGHPYFIGECGGAMEESRCIECGELVGGRSHNLLRSNRRWSGLSDLR